MQILDVSATDVDFLEALAELLMQAGRDRAADAIYAAMEGEALGSAAPRRPALKLVHSAEPA